MLWQDPTNTYGSIPHKLVETALERHHVPSKIRHLILDYDHSFNLRITVTLEWHRLEKGIITVILCTVVMNMLVKSAKVECRGPLTRILASLTKILA